MRVGYYELKATTATTIVMVCLSFTNKLLNFKKCWDFNRRICFKQICKGGCGELGQLRQLDINIKKDSRKQYWNLSHKWFLKLLT